MTLTYLNQTKSAVFDASGTATVVLRPDVGQWWQCSLIRVSTGRQSPPVSYAAVYHGSQAAIGPTTFIDDTFQANNDSSSIISGVVVQFGDAVVVKFQNGTIGDVAIATLYGQSSDRPDEFQLLSPGAHFAGHAATGTTSVILYDKTGVAFSVDTDIPIGFVGNFPYVGIHFLALSGSFSVSIEFYSDAVFNNLLASFVFDVDVLSSFIFEGSVPVQGPFCKIDVTPNGNSQCDIRVWSSPAEFTSPFVGPDNMILLSGETIAAPVGDTTLEANQVFPGNAQWSISSLLTTWSATLYAQDYTGTRKYLHKTDNSTNLARRQMHTVYLPPMPIVMVFNNGTAGAGNFNTSLVARPWTPGR